MEEMNRGESGIGGRPWPTLAEVEERVGDLLGRPEKVRSSAGHKDEVLDLYVDTLRAVARGAPRARQIVREVLRVADAEQG